MTLQIPKKKLFGWGWEDFKARLYTVVTMLESTDKIH
jgi:hypothetical protein